MSRLIDLTGQTFERWTVQSRDLTHKPWPVSWWCLCACGTVKSVLGNSLTRGASRSCGCLQKERMHQRLGKGRFDLTGQTFHRWFVLGPSPYTGAYTRWICQCSCGTTSSLVTGSLRSGGTLSCGCHMKEVNALLHYTHGMADTPEHVAWQKMRRRCFDPRDKSFKNYGGRGITVCDAWQTSFEAFFQHVGPRPSLQHSLDRYPDNNGNYEPGNVRWALPVEQTRNTRQNHYVTLDGITKCLQDWLESTHVARTTFYRRVRNGWSEEEAITTPADSRYTSMKYRKIL